MKKTVSVGTASAKAGTKSHGFLEVTTRADGSPLNIPVIVVNGIEEGPTLEVDACHHGYEYEGMDPIIRVGQALDPKSLKGTFIGVPVVNVPAFEANAKVNPYDYASLDLQRVYPGREGLITERIAQIFFNEIVCKTDYMITCHSGGNFQSIFPWVFYQSVDVSEDVSAKSLELAKAFGLNLIAKMPLGPGNLLHAAGRKGVPAILTEIGGCDRYFVREHYTRLHIRGIKNVMKHLGMLRGKAELPATQTFGDIFFIFNKYGGVWRPEAKLGGKVRKGVILGRVVDLFGNELEQIKSPTDGVLCLLWGYPIVHPGVELGCILSSTPPTDARHGHWFRGGDK